ncbi:MAG: tRNA lysidine(34) synthetase TilS [Bacteroidetes bacterium]|nr:tRNA lysidine(34) synthetase TilS [Bacteroidota bacterium]
MKDTFLQFIRKEQLFDEAKPMLLAVSGGVDSMVMAELFRQCNIPFAIAHCNFKLRGKESDRDEKFVKAFANKHKIKVFVKKFDTLDYAKSKGLSVQMAARELRYSWFQQLVEEKGFQAVATAHHMNDQFETFFINLIRGTGIRGLTGIPVKQEKRVRPLLYASRDEIEQFAVENNVEFRNDSSNDSLYYLRNQIRHLLLPAFNTIQPEFQQVMTGNIERIKEEVQLFRQMTETFRTKILHQENDLCFLDIWALLSENQPETRLFLMLEPFGFSRKQSDEIFSSLHKQSGKQFLSSTHRVIKDRKKLIIQPIRQPADDNPEFIIPEKKRSWFYSHPALPFRLKFSKGLVSGRFTINRDACFANLDLEKTVFPLILRKWKQGDSFKPYGMRGTKLISDFLTDRKLSLPEKENCRVLCSGEKIVWLVGMRIDNDYRIRKDTRNYLIISLLDT